MASRSNPASKNAQKQLRKQAKELAQKQMLEDLGNDADRDEADVCVYKRPTATKILEKVPGCFTKGKHDNKIVLTDEGYDQILKLASMGRSLFTIAYVLGISEPTLVRIMETDQEASARHSIGKAGLADRFTETLIKMAEQGNIAAVIWYEKTREGRRDNAPMEQGAQHVHIHFPDSVSPEEYMRSLAALHKDSHAKALAAAPPDPVFQTARQMVEQLAGTTVVTVQEDPEYQARVEREAKAAEALAQQPSEKQMRGAQPTEQWPPRLEPEAKPKLEKQSSHSRTVER